jgi:hypothetical protein
MEVIMQRTKHQGCLFSLKIHYSIRSRELIDGHILTPNRKAPQTSSFKNNKSSVLTKSAIRASSVQIGWQLKKELAAVLT